MHHALHLQAAAGQILAGQAVAVMLALRPKELDRTLNWARRAPCGRCSPGQLKRARVTIVKAFRAGSVLFYPVPRGVSIPPSVSFPRLLTRRLKEYESTFSPSHRPRIACLLQQDSRCASRPGTRVTKQLMENGSVD